MSPSQLSPPLDFDAAAQRAGVSSRMPLGVRPIRVKRIVCSAGKADKVGADFLPLGSGPAQGNYRAIVRKMSAGQELPPITVYQLGNRYFVIDGHTRVAAAKALGVEFIDANVTEALARKEGEINLTHYARKEFERHTGLEGIRLTAAWRYHLLHHHVEGYRLYLERSRGRDVSLAEAARIWARTQYLPTLMEIRRRKLTSNTGGRTAGDVYTDVLRAWTEEAALSVSLREMLDRYDSHSRRSALARVRRRLANVVDATLPKAIRPIGLPRARTFEESDVDAELAGLDAGSPDSRKNSSESS
ncbi:MAG: ParB/RepB/Spo0J family partition protein [Chloroflexota bacterium]